jgi:hypothetical protein
MCLTLMRVPAMRGCPLHTPGGLHNVIREAGNGVPSSGSWCCHVLGYTRPRSVQEGSFMDVRSQRSSRQAEDRPILASNSLGMA